MSSSTPAAIRFLLDENVRVELDTFLRERGFDVKRLPKGAPDRALAAASREEGRVLVTNDQDFSSLPTGKVFSLVLLRIPQRDVKALLGAFQRLLAECEEWESRGIVLTAAQWQSSPLAPKRSWGRKAA